MPSQSVEDYLKVIHRLETDGVATTGKIAEELGISPASVTNMTKRLVKMGLAEHDSHKAVHLSAQGRLKALRIIRHHRLLETFLIQIMGYTWDDVHAEAEQLEHHISEKFEEKMAEMLGDPLYDPHGDPIPKRDGTMPPVFTDSLLTLVSGDSFVIRRVSNADPEMLRHFFDRNLVPGNGFVLESKDPFSGPITLVEPGGTKQIIGHELAGRIFVQKLP
jgi:DtxR family Mn-dependent transcriptional regulator